MLKIGPELRISFHRRCGALIGVIITILVFAGLGCRYCADDQFLPTASHRRRQIVTGLLPAESGLRYAASQYLNATGEAAQYTALDNLHGATHRLQDNQGAFTVFRQSVLFYRRR